MVLFRFEGMGGGLYVAAVNEVQAIEFVERQPSLQWDKEWDEGSPRLLDWVAPSDSPEVMLTNHVINSMEERGSDFPGLAIEEDFPDGY